MLILASASPRRQELLRLITPDFRVVASETDERVPEGMPPRQAVEELALRKARIVAALYPQDTVVGADTAVSPDGARILGKPRDARDAAEMLRLLSGRQHFVYTGVAVLSPRGGRVFSEMTTVTFAALSDREIEAYVRNGEPMDKAGAYAAQGGAARFISRVEGDFHTVVGLPVCRLYQALRDDDDNKM